MYFVKKLMTVKPTGGLASPFGSEVERVKFGFTSSDGVSADEESVPISLIFTRGTGLGGTFFLRSASGLDGLLLSDSASGA